MEMKDWPTIVPLVQANLNHIPVSSLRNKAPIETFTGLPAHSVLNEIALNNGLCTLDISAARVVKSVEKLRSSLILLHKDIEDQREKQKLLNQHQARGEQIVNFEPGDYVLWSRVFKGKPPKIGNLHVRWIGHFQVISAQLHSFRIPHLLNGDERDVHASRLKFYSDSSLDVSEEIREHIASQGIILVVKGFLDYRSVGAKNRLYEIMVKWQGLEDIGNS